MINPDQGIARRNTMASPGSLKVYLAGNRFIARGGQGVPESARIIISDFVTDLNKNSAYTSCQNCFFIFVFIMTCCLCPIGILFCYCVYPIVIGKKKQMLRDFSVIYPNYEPRLRQFFNVVSVNATDSDEINTPVLSLQVQDHLYRPMIPDGTPIPMTAVEMQNVHDQPVNGGGIFNQYRANIPMMQGRNDPDVAYYEIETVKITDLPPN